MTRKTPTEPLELRTPRLRLRALTVEEARLALHGEAAALGASIEAQVSQWPGPDLAESLPEIVARMVAHPEEAYGWVWVVIDPAEGAVVGDIGFHSPVRGRRSVEIGYQLFPQARGRGLATEAASALVDWAFAQPGIARVTAQIDAANAPSRRVAEKLGMRETTPEDPHYLCFERVQSA